MIKYKIFLIIKEGLIAQETDFNSPKEMIDWLMRLIEANWRTIYEIKRR